MSALTVRGRRLIATDANGWVCQSCLRRTQMQGSTFAARRESIVNVRKGFRTFSQRRRDADTGLRRAFSSASSARSAVGVSREPILPDKPARTRFAPSPTGYLHIGGLRTALYSYLLAKRTKGKFLLRLEDTDQKRLVPGAEDRLLEDLRWAGLQWDEGPEVGGPHGPYKQSERNHIYQAHAKDLLDSGSAYRCFCTAQTTGHGAQTYVVSGCYQDCASLSLDEAQDRAHARHEPFTVRLRPPEDIKNRIYPDLVYGKIKPLKRSPQARASAAEDTGIDAADTILIKSDGTPTYHFANVVDDHLMEITHVIRGSEWMASTPLHYDLYQAFGWQPPAFAHVGLLVDKNRAKLSKRNSDLALDVRGMREEHGILPETLTNFVALLGWSNPTQNDVKELRELAEVFDLKFTKGNAMVRMEKLWYLQKQHVARWCDKVGSGDESMDLIAPVVRAIQGAVIRQFPNIKERLGANDESLRQYCSDILLADSKSYHNAHDYVERNSYFFDFDAQLVPAESASYAKNHQISAPAVQKLVKSLMEDFDFRQPYHNPRILGAGSTKYFPNPDKDRKMWFEKVSDRINAAINHEIWSAVLNHAQARAKGGAENYYILQDAELPFTDQPFDEIAFAGSCSNAPGIASTANPGDNSTNLPDQPDMDDRPVSGPAVNAALARKAAWKAALMKYLREKLSYGLPGPSMGVIMAILGYQECCIRLGVKARDGAAW